MENKKTLDDSKFPRSGWLVLLLFGAIGQIAWAVENMYFNLFVYDTIDDNLSIITLMVQLSGIVATVVTLFAGVLSDKLGNRRSFIAWGYTIWGVTVALFGCISPTLISNVFGISQDSAVSVALVLVVVGDCIMTLFGSTANDAAFNAWVTDNTKPSYRGSVESIISILPLLAMLVVAGGFGILKDLIGYQLLFISLGVVITAAGVVGIFLVRDADRLEKNGGIRDIFYGFRPSVFKANLPFYVTMLVVLVSGIACQIFMPYLIIFMSTYLSFTTLEYSAVFAVAILAGAGINVYLGKLSDRVSKAKMLYYATGIFSVGLLAMYFASMIKNHIALLILFGVGGFIMITGNILLGALSGSMTRDNTPAGAVGKLQGVRMVASVLIPMLIGPAIGNAINAARGEKLVDPGADAMTTEYIPAPEIFLAGAIVALLIFAVVPLLTKVLRAKDSSDSE